MTPKEALAVAYAQELMRRALAEGKTDVECMTVLKEAYEDAMTCIGYSIYFSEKDY